MSVGRIVLRVVLVLMLVGVCTLGYLVYQRRGPEYSWQQAQAAIEQKDFETAKIHLQKLLDKDPKHAQGHLELSRVFLQEARAAKQPGTYATNPAAMNHLNEAADLRPDDLEVQKELLNAYLQSRQLAKAAVVADRVIVVEPENPNALFALAWRAVDKKDVVRAEENFEKLRGAKSLRPFQTLALMVQHYNSTNQDKMQEELDRSLDTAQQTDAEVIASLSSQEQEALSTLLKMAVHESEDAEQTKARASTALDVLTKLQSAESEDSDKYATTAAEISYLVRSKGPQADTSPMTAELSEKANTILAAATKDAQAEPLVFLQAALAAFDSQDVETGLKLLQQGIDANDGEKLTKQQKAIWLELHLMAARKLVMLRRFEDAEKHVATLVNNSDSAGWGHLIAGSIAQNKGEQEEALSHFLQAQQQMGNTLLVKMGLANAYSGLKMWKQALPYLAELHVSFDQLDPEQRAWAAQHLGAHENIHFAELRALLSLNEWDDAQEHLKKLKGTKLEPNAWLLVGAYLLQQQEARQAIAVIDDARRKFPKDIGLARLKLAVLVNQKKMDEAETMLTDLAAAAPDDMTAQVLLVQWYTQQKDYDAALTHLEKLEEQAAGDKRKQLGVAAMKAQILLSQGDAQAVLDLVEPLYNDPETRSAAGILSTAAHLKNQDLGAASQSLGEVAKSNPYRSDVSLVQGQLAAAQGEYDQAVDTMAGLLDVTTLRDRARAILIKSLEQLAKEKAPDEVLAKIDSILAQHPKDTVMLLAKAELLIRVARADEALATLKDAEALQTHNAAVHTLKAQALTQKQQFEPALKEIEKSLEINPQHAGTLLLASQVSFVAQHYGDALDYALAAVNEDPKLEAAHLVQAQALEQLNREAEALVVLRSLVKAQPESQAAHLALAALLERTEDYEQALKAYQAASEKLPEELAFLAGEIRMLCKLDRLADAEELSAEVTAEETKFNTCVALSGAFSAAGQYDLAIKWGEKALELAEQAKKADVHLMLGNIALQEHEKTGDKTQLETSREHFAEVLKDQPRNLIAGNNLAWFLANDFDQPEEAVRICEQIRGDATVKQMPVSFVDTFASAYIKAKRAEDAQKLLHEAIALHPNEPLLYLQLGLALVESDQPGAARSALQRSLELGLSGPRSEEAARYLAELKATTP